MQVWCVEHDKYAGRGTAYYKVLIKPTDHQLNILRVRAMINPELSYWATRLDETCPDVEIETMLKQKRFRKEPYFTEVQVLVMDNDTAVIKNGKAYCIDCDVELTFDGELY